LLALCSSQDIWAKKCEEHLSNQNIQKLLEGPMSNPTQYKYAIEFLDHLQPADSELLNGDIPWLWKSSAQLKGLEARWQELFEGENKETLKLTLHRDVTRSARHIVLIGTLFNQEKEAIGFFGRTLYWSASGQAEAWGNGMYFSSEMPRSSGISKYVHLFLDTQIYPPLSISREGLEADYLGRYLWAKKGYVFDEAMIFTEHQSGRSYSVREIAQRNFLRFVDSFNLSLKDLVFDESENSVVPLIPEKHLLQPIDFLKVRHVAGLKLEVDPLLGYRTLAKRDFFEVGHAFLVADYKRDESDPGVSTQPYLPISSFGMPYWNGYVDVTKRSATK